MNIIDAIRDKTNPYQTVLVNPIMSAGKYPEKNITDKLLDCGSNTGNMLFVAGMKEEISYVKEVWVKGFHIEDVKMPAAVMPASNFIIHGDDGWINACQYFLDHTDCPFTLAGLGAQSTKELDTPAKLVKMLTPAKVNYFKNVSERAVSIGVRGSFTAECLELMGIHNYRIIGCPSFFTHLKGEYPRLPAPGFDRTQMSVTTGSTTETRIMELGMRSDSFWVMQMMTEMPKSAFEGETISRVWVDRRFPKRKGSFEDFSKYLRERTRIFFTMEEWDEFYKKEGIQFAFGSRFHGNMAALRNGVPALWITHDSRTGELVETLHLPHLTQKQFEAVGSIEELAQYCDYSDLYRNYPTLRKNYAEFLLENHIKVKF